MPTPEANEAKRAHARWLAVKIAIKAQYGANQGRSAEPQGDVEGVHSGVSYRKQRLDTRSEQKPRKHADRSRTMISGAAMMPFLQNHTATRLAGVGRRPQRRQLFEMALASEAK